MASTNVVLANVVLASAECFKDENNLAGPNGSPEREIRQAPRDWDENGG